MRVHTQGFGIHSLLHASFYPFIQQRLRFPEHTVAGQICPDEADKNNLDWLGQMGGDLPEKVTWETRIGRGFQAGGFVIAKTPK